MFLFRHILCVCSQIASLLAHSASVSSSFINGMLLWCPKAMHFFLYIHKYRNRREKKLKQSIIFIILKSSTL